MSLRKRRTTAAIMALSLSLALVGCASGGASPTATGAATPRVVTATPSIAVATATPPIHAIIRTAVANRPPDFAFVFTPTSCGESTTIDTFAGTFTVFVPSDGRYNAGTRTIPFAPTADEMRAVYQQMLVMGFFDYPPSLTTGDPRQGGRATNYDFRVRQAGREQMFHWTVSGAEAPTAMERDLAALTSLLRGIDYAHSETRAIPC